MLYMWKETNIIADGIEIYVYHSAPSPIYPFWHKIIAAFSVYEFTKHRLHITFWDCFRIIDGNHEKEFKRK